MHLAISASRCGLFLQRRTDQECKAIVEILSGYFPWSIVLIIVDLDHGGDPEERVKIATKMAREVIVLNRGDAFGAAL